MPSFVKVCIYVSCIVLVPLLFLSACSYRFRFTCFLLNHDLPAFCCSSDLIGEKNKKKTLVKILFQEARAHLLLLYCVLLFYYSVCDTFVKFCIQVRIWYCCMRGLCDNSAFLSLLQLCGVERKMERSYVFCLHSVCVFKPV